MTLSVASDSWSSADKPKCVEMESFFVWEHVDTYVNIKHTLVASIVSSRIFEYTIELHMRNLSLFIHIHDWVLCITIWDILVERLNLSFTWGQAKVYAGGVDKSGN